MILPKVGSRTRTYVNRVVVLLSGGVDSSVAARMAQTESPAPAIYAMSVMYGQRHAAELECAKAQAHHLGVAIHKIVSVDLGLDTPLLRGGVPKNRADDGGVAPTYFPGRNTVFLSLALSWAESIGARDIYLGANADDKHGYPDCRDEFFRAFEWVARVATKAGLEGAAFRVRTPLASMSKVEIVRRGLSLGVNFANTLSCYDPVGSVACGECDSCQLRLAAFQRNGVQDPISYRRES